MGGRYPRTYGVFHCYRSMPRLVTGHGLILSGEITTEQAISELNANPLSDELKVEATEYLKKKFEITESELNEIMTPKIRSYSNYKNNSRLLGLLKKCSSFFEE